MSKNSQARFHNVKAVYQFCIVEEYLIHFLFGLIGRCRTRCAERMVWVAGGGVLGIVPMAGRLASAAATQRRAVTLNVTRDRASPTQRPPIPLARAASLGSPASGAMAAPASGKFHQIEGLICKIARVCTDRHLPSFSSLEGKR